MLIVFQAAKHTFINERYFLIKLFVFFERTIIQAESLFVLKNLNLPPRIYGISIKRYHRKGVLSHRFSLLMKSLINFKDRVDFEVSQRPGF